MTDRELLELAAKAAGAAIRDMGESGIRADEWIRRSDGSLLSPNKFGHAQWNPLTDDGDALRLAVELGLRIDVFLKRMEPFTRVWWGSESSSEEEHRKDPATATRRAIVRAAAAIGSSR